ncbi:hypothetical protein TruAng_005962 [Truncatella angustata]|nr:hypothetical protein TruAng_005962 [Truncatella angustata]
MSSTVASNVRPTLFPHFPSPAVSIGPQQQRQLYSLDLKQLQHPSLANKAALRNGGLPTPPSEANMSTAYHPHNSALSSTYNSHVTMARQPAALTQLSRIAPNLCDATAGQITRNQPQQQNFGQQHQPDYLAQPQQSQYASNHTSVNSLPLIDNSRNTTRPSTPSSTATSVRSNFEGVSRRDSAMVMHSLKLPSCIAPNGGNLDDFASLMTCFFWFENMETIQAAEQIKTRPSTSPIPPLSSYTRPGIAYKKWVNSILTTTQVTQNVILLALLFVYRLKSRNAKVNGSPGSEYRLLTVALMLGNKFLDDNTYTNKTWAEVSGIAVKEIHVMEVEFLSNMRYGLLVSKEQWEDWIKKLACFHEYCEEADAREKAAEMAAAVRRQRAQVMPLNLSSPTHHGFGSPLPSPTNILPSSMQPSPASLAAYSPNAAVYNSKPNWPSSYQQTPALSPLAAKPSLAYPMNGRKRSLESSERSEPAPKRTTRPPPAAGVPTTGSFSGVPESDRLSVPHLTLDTSQIVTPVAYQSTSAYSQGPVSLPPLSQGMRAMSTVYPHATTWASQAPTLATCGPQTPSYAAPSHFGTPTKRHSPGSLAVFASLPLEPFATHTPSNNSPLVYLQQRNSPYKPVRPVNTLNYPPPSVPLSEYHLGSAQMHYQSLGRRNVRTGIVPEFLPTISGGRPTPIPTTQTHSRHYHPA